MAVNAEKLIGLCNDDQQLELLKGLSHDIVSVACQKHGSFSVQALVDTLHTAPQLTLLVDCLRADVVRLMTHPSGHFVVGNFLAQHSADVCVCAVLYSRCCECCKDFPLHPRNSLVNEVMRDGG